MAVAANFTTPMQKIAESFERETGNKVVLSFGATGSFYSQIKNGAPYQILLSADNETPRKLICEGFASANTQFTYATGQLTNVSARAQVGTGNGVLIAGFVISGTTNKTVLIRGIGPALATYGVAGVLPDPRLDIYASGNSTPIYTNIGWGTGGSANTAALTAAFTSTGAFQLTNTSSNDSALLISLPPGVYSAQVKGASGDTGVALIEVYLVQ